MRKEHLDLLDAATIRAIAIAGPPDECVARLRGLEESGVTDLAVVLGGNANELMRRFSTAVMRHWR